MFIAAISVFLPAKHHFGRHRHSVVEEICRKKCEPLEGGNRPAKDDPEVTQRNSGFMSLTMLVAAVGLGQHSTKRRGLTHKGMREGRFHHAVYGRFQDGHALDLRVGNRLSNAALIRMLDWA